jgi:putative hydrolase of the HAD superfamily
MAIEAVIFDWGGTLTPWHVLDPLDSWRAYAEVAAPDDVQALASALHEAEEFRWVQQSATAGEIGTGRLDDLFAHLDLDTSSATHRQALEAYLRWWDPHTVADPDARPLLSALRERGIAVGVLSNTLWPRWHFDEVFARDGLTEYIDVAVFTSELCVGKPHAEAFTAILESLGISDASHVAYVGDRAFEDVHGAQSVGMRGILFPHDNFRATEVTEHEVTPDAVVQRLADVLAVIDGWNEESSASAS